jgi:hypothetical protein
MSRLALITQGHAEYDPRLKSLLDESGIDPHEFSGLDWFGLTPFYVLAGATVTPQAHTHGPDIHVEAVVVDLADDLPLDSFLAALEEMLRDAYSEEE